MAQVTYNGAGFALIINKDDEPRKLLEWISEHHDVLNPIARVSLRDENFKVEMRVNATLHEQAAKFINEYK